MTNTNHKTHTIARTIMTSFSVIIIIAFIVGMCFFANIIFTMKQEIKSIQSSLDDYMNNLSISNDTVYYDSYIALSEKAEAEMSRLVSVVGIIAAVYTIFGALIVFKAPHEIDKRIGKLDSIISNTSDSAQEARYQVEIIDAVANDFNGEMTNYDKLCNMSKVIDKYPAKPDAYMERGFIYDNMGKYDEAISDYKFALKKGFDKSSCYGDIGVALNKKGDYKKAISFYSKAIKLDPEDASTYANRGACFDDMSEFDKALDDYNKAIELDDGCKKAYINRSLTYKHLMHNEYNQVKKQELYDLMIADLNIAFQLDPDDETTKSHLKSNLNSNIDSEAMIAKIDEKIGDLELESKNFIPALKQYIESCNCFLIKFYQGNENHLANVERLISKIFSINTEVKTSNPSIASDNLDSFCKLLNSVSVNLYTQGNKNIAEKGFLIVAKYNVNHKGCLLNLAFMKRRGETKFTHSTVSELLDQCSNLDDALWCTNKALCYVSGSDNHETSWEKAVEIMNKPIENIDEAFKWWDDIDVVGSAENNIAMILFNVSKKFQFEDRTPLNDRVRTAIEDGYFIPPDINI